MNDKYSIEVAKVVIEKSIINELFNKRVISFETYNNIIKKVNEKMNKARDTYIVNEKMQEIVVNISI